MNTTTSNFVRVSRRNPCPVCGKPDWCLLSRDGKAVICSRIESDKPVGNKGAGWLHNLNGDRPIITPVVKSPTERRQPRDNLNTVYSALISQLLLSARHRDNLLARGLSKSAIDYFQYRTLPAEGRGAIAHTLNKDYDLIGAPGFWIDNGNPAIAGPAGIFIPVRDTQRRIIGFQIRVDVITTGGKYRWFSSAGYPKGCSSGAPVHVARAKDTTAVWITEGLLKADIAAFRLHRTVLAVPGVGHWPGVIPILRELKPEKVIVAYDSDRLSNDAVSLHSNTLINHLYQKYRTFEANWPPEYKGIDDLLSAGVLEHER